MGTIYRHTQVSRATVGGMGMVQSTRRSGLAIEHKDEHERRRKEARRCESEKIPTRMSNVTIRSRQYPNF